MKLRTGIRIAAYLAIITCGAWMGYENLKTLIAIVIISSMVHILMEI